MKSKLNIFIAIVCLLASVNLKAQKIDSYTLKLPDLILGKGSPVYVDTLRNTNPAPGENGLQTRFIGAMKNGLAASGLAYEHNLVLKNPWMETDLYQSTDNKEEATYVIAGEYHYTTESKKSYTECTGTESRDSLPFVYYKYTASSKATISGKVTVTDNESQTVIKEYPFSETKSAEKTLIMEHPSVKSPDSFLSSLDDKVISNHQYMLNAVLVKYQYDFPKIKAENKDLRKPFREFHKELKDHAKDGNLNEMKNIYVEIQQKEDSKEVNECLGMCYEMIGNYTKAKSYYEKANAGGRIEHLNKQIAVQKQLNALNIETPENEF